MSREPRLCDEKIEDYKMNLTAYSGRFKNFVIEAMTNLPKYSYNKRNIDRLRVYLIPYNSYIFYVDYQQVYKPKRIIRAYYDKMKDMNNKNTSFYESFISIFMRLKSQI